MLTQCCAVSDMLHRLTGSTPIRCHQLQDSSDNTDNATAVLTVEKNAQKQDKVEMKVASEVLPASTKGKKDKSNKTQDQKVRCFWQCARSKSQQP